MSKQFDSKRESLSIINRAYNEKARNTSVEEKFLDLQNKYKILSDRTKKLEEVYKFHKGVIQNISSGILTIDSDENITFVNTAALKVLEFEFGEMIGTSVRKIFADQQEAEVILRELIESQRMFESEEVNLLSRTGKIIPIGFTTTMLSDDASKHQGVILSFRDLTNLYNFRHQMERMDRLATLGEVSAGIAHEIRNPLAGIKTSAQVLEESFSPGDSRSQLVSRIVREIDRSNELLKKFFNFAKPGKPRQEFIAMDAVINGVYILLSSKMKKKGIQFITAYEDDLPQVYVDENQIEQVLINIFMNAMDAMASGGKIYIRTGLVDIEETNAKYPRMLRVEIEDTGCGIESQHLEKIFNPFYTTKSDGVGLGLSISTRLIEENGGQLRVKSNPGDGTLFSLFLPIN